MVLMVFPCIIVCCNDLTHYVYCSVAVQFDGLTLTLCVSDSQMVYATV
jgi:hypothetical protein